MLKKKIALLSSLVAIFFLLVDTSATRPLAFSDVQKVPSDTHSADLLPEGTEIGRPGGVLTFSQHSEPKTLNPLIAIDLPSRNIIGLMMSDLIHINRATFQTEPALAQSWKVSPDRRVYTLFLHQGLRFSDGSAFSADDVVFSWSCYLDPKTNSPQRDLLTISGQPIRVQKIDEYTVKFTLPHAYGAAERLFDGIAILPQHLLRKYYERGTLPKAWGISTPPDQIAGLGPFRLKQYIPGQQIILERNPYYWEKDRKGQSLPYLASIRSIFVASADAEALRFDAGETDVINHLNPLDFATLQMDQSRRQFRLYDVGPGLEYSFLFFNQNALAPNESSSMGTKQSWFQQVAFRQAISSAINREDLVRLAYRGRARALSVQVTPGNKPWIDPNIPKPVYSLPEARELMRSSGFSWGSDGALMDAQHRRVEFSLLVNAGNPQQVEMGTLIQQDLKKLGVGVTLDQIEFHTFLNRIFTTYKYEAALIALADGDADPNSELNFLSSNGGTHVWDLNPHGDIPAWQRQVDRLMQQQLIAPNYRRRKEIYDDVQQLIWENMPVVFLVSPDILVGAKDRIRNFRPVVLGNYTLWNADCLFVRQ